MSNCEQSDWLFEEGQFWGQKPCGPNWFPKVGPHETTTYCSDYFLFAGRFAVFLVRLVVLSRVRESAALKICLEIRGKRGECLLLARQQPAIGIFSRRLRSPEINTV